jgi:YidC/Oxa1 family membrane protein insertase
MILCQKRRDNMQKNMPDIRNLMIAIALSISVMLCWQIFVEQPQREAEIERTKQLKENQPVEGTVLPNAPQETSTASSMELSRDERVEQHPRVRIDTNAVHGSVNLRGLRIDDLTLASYHETPDETSPEVSLLSPAGGKDSYFAEFGWLPASQGVATPTASTEWQVEQETLTASRPLVAKWDNGAGLIFSQTIASKDDYLFAVEQQVRNDSDKPVTLYPYGLISRTYADTGQHIYILHEGPIGVFDQALTEVDYEALRDDGKQSFTSTNGWLGITDKYWLTTLIPNKEARMTASMAYLQSNGQDKYQIDYRGDAVTVNPGETITITNHLFAGAKKVALLDRYGEQLGIPLFDRAVDFGMLYFLTKPIFLALTYFNSLLGNFGLAIMLLTVCIKILLFPLANKSYVAMSQLKILMPKITTIRERYADDKIKMNQEIMELYKREKVNPASGCLPLVLQIPVFFALYKVLYVTIEMRHAPFYGWITDLSAPDPTTIFNLFGLIPWDPPTMLHIGAWPIIMCITMVIQQHFNPKPTDPTQAMVMKWLPYIFLFVFASFPAGLVIYWAWNNTLSVMQQQFITRKHRAKYGIA